MADKELYELDRVELIDVIHDLRQQVDDLTKQNVDLKNALEENNAGNLAEAAFEINNCFQSVQNAAEQYLDEIKLIYAQAEKERKEILNDARIQVKQFEIEPVISPVVEQSEISNEVKIETVSTSEEEKSIHDDAEAILKFILEQNGLR